MSGKGTFDVNLLLEELGGLGKFQIWVFVLCCFAAAMPGILVVNVVFVGFEPPYRCAVPYCESSNNATYNADFLNFTTPVSDNKANWASCSTYGYASVPESERSCDVQSFDFEKRLNCSEYVYDNSLFESSTVTEYDLVCDRSWLQPAANSALMIGMLFGAVILGDLADRVGRRKGLVLASLLFSLTGIINGLSQNYYMFLATRFAIGAGGIAMFQIAFIIVVEFVTPEWRKFVGVMIEIPYALGEASGALFAYYIRDWRMLQIACMIPSLLVLSYWWVMPESIRWLISSGRMNEANKLVKKIEEVNNISVSRDVYEALEQHTDAKGSSAASVAELRTGGEPVEDRNLLDIIRYPNIRKRTLILMYTWAALTLSYYGLAANASNLSGNFFINFISLMLIEIPSYIFAYILLDILGRKGTLCFVVLLGGFALLSAAGAPSDLSWLIVTLSMIGKFGTSAGFGAIFVYTSEVYPTSYRSIGLGTCSMSARIGGILAPFIASSAKIFPPLPLYIFGLVAVVAGFLIFLLPETLGCELPQTLEKCENFGVEQPILYFSCFASKNEKKSEENGSRKEIALNNV